MYEKLRFLPAGDKALAVELGNAISPEINRRVRDLFVAIESQEIAGVMDLVPTYRSLLVYYDPLRLSTDDLERRIAALAQNPDAAALKRPRVVEVPTVYGGEYGPDLAQVVEHNKLTAEEVIRIHSGTDYLVYMMGFAPGFPYLGGMSEKIATPRLQTPRTLIPAGSVGIAERQTGIYPTDSPGGWQLIGRTPVQLFDPQRQPPVVVEPGDYIRFVQIAEATYLQIQKQVQTGAYRITAHEVK
ncbi:MAG: 5-oxoprolinase subunit PxpB [Chloroflexi bacterium]|nr:5-oxoprolinase subunit PxpB [Chloroflexota bacterium]